MFKAFKYRIYPNKQQTELLNKHFGCTRFVYNWALNKRIEAYQTEQQNLSRYDLQKDLVSLKKECLWLREINSQSLQSTLLHLENAYTKFFRERKGFPKFKKKHNHQSFSCPQSCKVDFEKGVIVIPKVKGIKAVFSRKFDGNIKTVTFSKTCTNKFYASVLVEMPDVKVEAQPIITAATIGIDLGIKDFATLSTGEKIENPKHLRERLKHLKKQQGWLSRKVKGSNNRNKQRLVVAKLHEKVANKRQDFLHKVSTKLVGENQTIALETLNVAGMMKNRKLAQSIADVSWSKFNEMLEYKAKQKGVNILRIGRFEPSSKLCVCGTLNNNLTLKDRIWMCEVCGQTHDRDILASQNIKRMALNQLNIFHTVGRDTPKPNACGVESLDLTWKQESSSISVSV